MQSEKRARKSKNGEKIDANGYLRSKSVSLIMYSNLPPSSFGAFSCKRVSETKGKARREEREREKGD